MIWALLACGNPVAVAPADVPATEQPAQEAVPDKAHDAPDTDEQPPEALGAADIQGLPESVRAWFHVVDTGYDGATTTLGAVDRAAWERWQKAYDPLTRTSADRSVWTIEAAPSRICASSRWQLWFRWQSERRAENGACDSPDLPPPRMDGEVLVFDLPDDELYRQWLCPAEEVGGWHRSEADKAHPNQLRLASTGNGRAVATFCGGSVEVVVGESADERFRRWEKDEALRRARDLHSDLRVSTKGVTWRGEPVTCRLGFERCNPEDVRVWCEGAHAPGEESAVIVKFGPDGPSTEVDSAKCVDTALIGI